MAWWSNIGPPGRPNDLAAEPVSGSQLSLPGEYRRCCPSFRTYVGTLGMWFLRPPCRWPMPSSRVSPPGAVCVRKEGWNETTVCAPTQGTFQNTGKKKQVFQPRHRRPGGGGLCRPDPASPPSVISYIGHGRLTGGPCFHRCGGFRGGGAMSPRSLSLTNPGKVIVLVHS